MMQEGADSAPGPVFVLDDDPSVRKALARLFKSAGFSVETFGSAVEFMASGRHREGGCLVIDVHMPCVNGFELRSKLLSIGVNTPVVFITAHDTEQARARAMESGAAAYFAKPFDSEELLATVSEKMRGKGAGK